MYDYLWNVKALLLLVDDTRQTLKGTQEVLNAALLDDSKDLRAVVMDVLARPEAHQKLWYDPVPGEETLHINGQNICLDVMVAYLAALRCVYEQVPDFQSSRDASLCSATEEE